MPENNQPSKKEEIAAGLLQYLNSPDQSAPKAETGEGKKKSAKQSKRAGKPVSEFTNKPSDNTKEVARKKRAREVAALKAMSEARKKGNTEEFGGRKK